MSSQDDLKKAFEEEAVKADVEGKEAEKNEGGEDKVDSVQEADRNDITRVMIAYPEASEKIVKKLLITNNNSPSLVLELMASLPKWQILGLPDPATIIK